MRRSMWAAIRSLKPKHRAAVVLRYYRGFSEAEMAVALSCPRGTVKSRLHSALRQLEEILRQSRTQEDVPRRSQKRDRLKQRGSALKRCTDATSR